jgi:4-hydroxymandelate oxidase
MSKPLIGEVAPWADVADLEQAARRRMSPEAAVYVGGGAGEEVTLRANEAAFRRYHLMPRVLRDTAALDTSVDVLGVTFDAPLWLAPAGMQSSIHPEGEHATAAAAAATGLGYVLSSGSSVTLEEVAVSAPPARWFQLYKISDDAEILGDLVQRAVASGYRGLCLTVDSPVHGYRRAALRHSGSTRLPDSVMANLAPYRDRLAASEVPRPFEPVPHFPTTWADLTWLREITDLPILCKGVLHPDDAAEALARGAQGVIVSNHGGRQLDQCVATLDALPAVVAAVGERGTVLFDGGVRTAADAVIALALGARAVGLGRAVLWALGAGGRVGVETFLRSFRTDLARVMHLVGAAKVSDLNPDLVFDRRVGRRGGERP